jgi:spore germination cell wall hydrolase CwlJ-like protein
MESAYAIALLGAAGAFVFKPTGDGRTFSLEINGGSLSPLPEVSGADIQALTLNVYHEARGEGTAGWLAVLNVCRNRLKSGDYPDNYHDIVYQPKQFSWTADGLTDTPQDSETYADIKKYVVDFLTGQAPDNTGGALFYCNPAGVSGGVEGFMELFSRPLIPTVNIGRHSFFA